MPEILINSAFKPNGCNISEGQAKGLALWTANQAGENTDDVEKVYVDGCDVYFNVWNPWPWPNTKFRLKKVASVDEYVRADFPFFDTFVSVTGMEEAEAEEYFEKIGAPIGDENYPNGGYCLFAEFN